MRALWSLVVVLPLSIGAAAPDASARSDEGKKVTFMTRNLYFGAELASAVEAIVGGDPIEIMTAVGDAWANVRNTDFPTRAVAIADEVKLKKPDFLGIQEVGVWSVGVPFDPADADTVVYDFLDILQDALAARGMRYDVVAVAEGVTAEAPGFDPESPYEVEGLPLPVYDIRLHSRDVLLVKHGGDMKISNASGHQFENNAVVGPFVSTYGWVQADVKMGQRQFRVVSAHLDADFEFVRDAQAAEVLAGPCDTSLPLVVLGDFNSDGNGGASGAPYEAFRDAGFGDAWVDEYPDDPGLTYGQEPTLTEPYWLSAVYYPLERVDYVLYHGEFTTEYADRVGETVAEMYGGLWPSDHAGVVATLRVR